MTISEFALTHGIDRILVYEAFRLALTPVKNREFTEQEISDIVRAEVTRRMDCCRKKIGLYETVIRRL